MHYKVFLDTNIYDATNYSFRNDLFMQMRNYAESGMLEMQICSVVKNEVCRHIKNKIKGTVVLAFKKALEKQGKVVERPKALGDIRGISYIYPMLYRFGVIEAPEKNAIKMQLKGQ